MSEPETLYETREQWLRALVDLLRPVLETAGASVPDVAISVGFPLKAGRGRNRAIGQCWDGQHADDGRPQVFIHPELSDPIDVAAVVLHEVIHAAPESLPRSRQPHGRAFAKIARQMGLQGKMTATTPSDVARDMLTRMTATLGIYPHGRLNALSASRKQSTRMLKAVCDAIHDPYVVRLARTTAERGLPSCGDCGEPMRLDMD